MNNKIIIAGVGGQGVVFLTEILVDAAIRSGINAATSEIHGLSQRGGSVVAGVTFGENTFGFVENGAADFLLGLELLEAKRALSYLHCNSIAIIDNTKILPHSVNAQKGVYPDTKEFISYLMKNIKETIFIDEEFSGLTPVMRNIVVLGKAASVKNFPVKSKYIEDAIRNNARGDAEKSLKVFRDSLNSVKKIKAV